jgi:hypothetical protein
MFNQKWLILNGVFFTVFYIIPLVILPWCTSEYDYVSYSNVHVDRTQALEDDHTFKLQIPDYTSTHLLDVWPVGWIFYRLKSFLFVTSTTEVKERSHNFIKIRSALMVSYAVSNRLQTFLTLR